MVTALALCGATSCVPNARPAGHVAAAAAPVRDAETLLRKLDLQVPSAATQESAGSVAPVAVTAPPPFLAAAATPDDAARARDCLTAAVYYEARSEPLDGQRAVAQVVLNRVRDRAFPASVCGVVYQGSTRRTGCQFSFTCDGSMDRPRDPSAWQRADAVAAAALSGSVYAPVGGATYYHASSILPWWAPSLTRIGAVGQHIFYRWRTAMERVLAFHQDYSGTEPLAGTPAADGATVAGVAIHRGADTDAVIVHRGTITPAAPAAAEIIPVATTGVPSAAPRVKVVNGVRVHSGAPAPVTTAPATVDPV